MSTVTSRTRLTVVSLVSVAALALVVAGCGSSSGKASPASSSASALKVDAASAALLPARIKASGTIRFASISNPPFRIINGNDTTGAEIELDNALAALLGVKADIQNSSSGDVVRTGILADRFDVFMGPSQLNADRHTQFDGVEYIKSGSGIIVLKSNTTINASDDLCGKKVAVIVNGTDAKAIAAKSTDCTSKGKAAITSLALNDPQTLVLAVLSGQADAASATTTLGADSVRTNPTLRTFSAPESDPILGKVSHPGLLTLPDLSAALFSAFKILFANGTYQRIMEKWGLHDAIIPDPFLNKVE